MAQHGVNDQHDHVIRDKPPYWKRAHQDWRFWVGLFLMLTALAIYIMSDNLSRLPHLPVSADGKSCHAVGALRRKLENVPQHRIREVVSVRGSVVDVRFDAHLPPIYSLLHARDGKVAIEVLAQLDDHRVRGIALTPTEGLARGNAGGRHGRAVEGAGW